ncbi:MAG: LysR family transcriptional regulator [Aquincola tertiaricarbonis]|uniref:LysR family transcriptional regulator n=1 Tax=Aquincola sp. J276 TaxID=2898432 RepID=UPI0021511FB2|nr:LysR family transcriptional regulator [Aquincola sp. J276]MCR5868540.1 LysR family transcriptional regulator [Aquincola sp. J276]
MSKLPDLEAWAIFAKVAETGSFAKAAADLAISQPTVSKAITRLEARLKTTLFHRTSRRMSLTASGEASLDRASRILAEGEAVEAEVTEQSEHLRGTIRIAAPMSFGISHLGPALPAFMAQHPEVMLDLHFSDELIDVVAQGFDVALRISALPDSSLLARRLCAVRILLVGAPAYFEQHGRPGHPRELATHRALRYVHTRLGEAWRFRHARRGEFSQVVPTALRVNNAEALAPALRAGLGLALQPEFLAWEDLRSGLLEEAMPEWQVPPIALHIVTPPGRGRPARVQVLIDYLAAHFARAPWAVDPSPMPAAAAASAAPR